MGLPSEDGEPRTRNSSLRGQNPGTKLEVSKLHKKSKSQIRHWKLNWTKAKVSSKAQKKKRASRHRAQKEFCWMLPGSHINWLCHRATTNGLSLGMQFETHFQKLWWILSYPRRSELTLIEFILLSDELEDSLRYPEWLGRHPKKYFLLLTHTASLHISAFWQAGTAMILNYGQRNLGKSDAF